MSVSWQQLDPPQPKIHQERVSHDEIYFLKDFATIQIEDRLFRIPRYHLIKESCVFMKWSKDEMNPTIVDDVTLEEFYDFLRILLPGFSADLFDFWIGEHEPSEEAWITVLKLSTKWFCLKIRRLAIKKLDSKKVWPPAKSVMLGCKYYVEHWVISGYKDLLTRHDGISDEEATDIGLRKSLQIMRMRETPYFGDYVEAEIRRVFKDELAEMEAMNRSFISSTDIS